MVMKLPNRSMLPGTPSPPPGSPGSANQGVAADPSRLQAVPNPRELADALKEHAEKFRKVKEIDRSPADTRGGDGVPVDLSRQSCSTVRSAIPSILAESMSLAEEPDPAARVESGSPAPAGPPPQTPAPRHPR